MDFVVMSIVFWIGAIIVAHVLGSKKGRTSSWLWGFFLGWIGVIVVACQSEQTKLSAKQKEVAELEAELKLAELRKRQAGFQG
jgi:hypothetical protein